MEYSIKLHQDPKLFSDTLRAASNHLKIKLEFVEKDYWISLVLSNLAKSKYAKDVVFKCGTSLSKAYDLIERFSEDVDIAIISDDKKTGNEIKTIIRNIEKGITVDLKELRVSGITSKGSRFRKSVFEYETTGKNNANNKLIIEVNSFANPFPFEKKIIKNMIFDFLTQTGNEQYVEKYDLQPFELSVLSINQTLLEKTVSLIRFSFSENFVQSISGKIRHFYDLYYLMQNPECAKFLGSAGFKKQFDAILNHDRKIFEEPVGWQSKSILESPLIIDFPNIWKQLKEKYKDELSALAYREIPDEKDIGLCFEKLIKKIK